MKKILKKFDVPIYGCTVWVIVDDSYAAAVPRLRRAIPDLNFPDADDDEGAACLWKGKTFVIYLSIRELAQDRHNAISHEVHHLVVRVMEAIGHTVAAGTDEPSAYLDGWLTSRINKIIRG